MRKWNMNELNSSLAANLGTFFSEMTDEVAKGLLEFLQLNGGLLLEKI